MSSLDLVDHFSTFLPVCELFNDDIFFKRIRPGYEDTVICQREEKSRGESCHTRVSELMSPNC